MVKIEGRQIVNITTTAATQQRRLSREEKTALPWFGTSIGSLPVATLIAVTNKANATQKKKPQLRSPFVVIFVIKDM